MFHDQDNFQRRDRQTHHVQARDWAIRTEFGALIDELEAIRAGRDPVYYLIKLEQMRIEARRCRLGALVAVTENCERALARAVQAGNARHFERDYALLMREAIDCGDASPDQCEALLASVAHRMTG